jgi:PAS domain S-box-containing protein
MNRQDIIEAILESLPKPIVAVDENQIILYMNRAARDQHTDLTGRSLLDCHKKDSVSRIHEIAGRLEAGEQSITLRGEDGFIKSYFVAIQDYKGRFAGYYEMMDRRA